MFTNQDIIDYYNNTERDYRVNWGLDKNLALNFGYWDHETRNLYQAVRRLNEVMIRKAEIQPKHLVLDAGCGVGGSSIHMARQVGCRVTGITLCSRQVELAGNYSKRENVSHLTRFEVQDYTQTNFDDRYFDIVWAIQSASASVEKDKGAFVKEAYRILKPGGKLIVADLFKTKPQMSLSEAKLFYGAIGGGVTGELLTIEQMVYELGKTGYHDIQIEDMTGNVIPAIRLLYLLSFPGIGWAYLKKCLGSQSRQQLLHAYSANLLSRSFQKGLWGHHIVLGVK